MEMNLKHRIASGALALSLMAGSGAAVTAHHNDDHQKGGAAGLVAAVVQVSDTIDITDSNVEVVSVDVNDSFNNLTALNNILNNSPILSNNDIDVVDVIDIDDINVLSGEQQDVLTNFLNNNDIDVVVGVAVLDGGDLVVLT